MPQLWFISDLHLGHHNIIKFDDRPFSSIEEHDVTIMNNCNTYVKPNDTLYILGDIAKNKSAYAKHFLKNTHGKKFLIWGNHDRNRDLMSKYCVQVQDYMHLWHNDPTGPFEKNGIFRQFIVMSHYAMRAWDKSYHGSIMLHGHSHGNLVPLGDRSLDVSINHVALRLAEMSGVAVGPEHYRPVNYDEIKAIMNHMGQTGDASDVKHAHRLE